MEAFSLLKYWRGGGGGGLAGGGSDAGTNLRASASAASTTTTTTIVTAVTRHAAETDDDDDDDDGPFFDLEFAVQDEAEEEEEEEDGGEKNDTTNDGGENGNDEVDYENDGAAEASEEDEEEDDGEEREFNFTISSNSSGNDRTDPNLTLSPSDDLFFKGRLVPIEPSSLVFNSAEPNSKPQFPVSLLKSATKFRVFMLGFKKSKQNASEKPEQNNATSANAANAGDGATPKQQQKPEVEKEKQSKFFTVKFKVEEVPIVSLFTRDNNGSRKSQSQKHHNNNVVEDSVSVSVSDEKRFSKDVMQKYLKKVKPLYVRVSKRYGEKLKFSGQLSLGSAAKSVQSPPPPQSTAGQKPKPTADKSQTEAASAEPGQTQMRSQKQANIPERLRIVCKHLGKSRSASSAVAAAPTAPVVQRRDDSLLQQQDNIQSAILHCKRSFNASRDSSDSSMLPRSISDPSNHKSTMKLSRKSSDEV